MDAGGDRVFYSSNIAVIREVYDTEYSPQCFSIELEKALDAGCLVIIIEPTDLGDETARWISCGNYLHKTAVVTGISSVVVGLIWPDSITSLGLGVCCFLATGLHAASWQFDPCVKYQVERDPRKLARLPVLGALTFTSPVVLVRKDDKRRKILQYSVCLSAVSLCLYRLYRFSK